METLTHAWFLVPALALILGVLALAPLGAQVLARGVVFMDLAVAQAAAAAALWAGSLIDADPWQTQALAAGGALLCVAVVAALSKRWQAEREALIGLLYVMGASAALLGAQRDPHGRERLSQLLAADVLWADWQQAASLGACVLLLALLRTRLQRDGVFFAVFALVVSVAVPVLGLLMVFAALIAPALLQRAGWTAWAASLAAMAACLLGLCVSWVWDAPSGACVVLCLSLLGLLSALRRHPRRPAGQEG